MVPTARLELAQLSPLPPQDSVSTNFTTSALLDRTHPGREENRLVRRVVLRESGTTWESLWTSIPALREPQEPPARPGYSRPKKARILQHSP
jgi:hypothetical protein